MHTHAHTHTHTRAHIIKRLVSTNTHTHTQVYEHTHMPTQHKQLRMYLTWHLITQRLTAYFALRIKTDVSGRDPRHYNCSTLN